MPSCVIKYCRNNIRKNKKADGITFHVFPVDPIRRSAWIKTIQEATFDEFWQPSSNRSVICSLHFDERSFNDNIRRNLKKDEYLVSILFLRKACSTTQIRIQNQSCHQDHKIIKNMQKVPQKNKIPDSLSVEELEKLDKKVLIEKIKQLEAHNFQLKNIIKKQNTDPDSEKQKSQGKPYDFTKCHYRKILLRIMYFGWSYQGLAVQEDSNKTIEHNLFNALTRSCLIPNRENSDYHRCGRTDKGVSSFGQVISIRVRSKLSKEEQIPENVNREIQYCAILNRLLPDDIKAVGWKPLTDDGEFSARFNCKRRSYKYYFPKSNLDLDSMRSACSYLVGHHDFRNLCKMDVGNGVVEFKRHLFKADILYVDGENETAMYCLLIEGNAFLWHQIRCIFAVLLLIGQKKETPSVILELLDVEKYPRKPQYPMALDLPLNLYNCEYDLDEKWVYEMDELKLLIQHMQTLWTVQSIKTTMIKDCLKSLEDIYKKETENGVVECETVMAHTECLLQGVRTKVYQPLMCRKTCSSLEEKINYYKKRRRVSEDTNSEEI